MKYLSVIGSIMVILGTAAILLSSVTFFTRERVADAGMFTIDISKPHTIFFSPIVGGIILGSGIILAIVGFRAGAASK